MVGLTDKTQLVYQMTNVVMVSLTVLVEKMNSTITVPVDLREQFV
jgi:hypothetical protein